MISSDREHETRVMSDKMIDFNRSEENRRIHFLHEGKTADEAAALAKLTWKVAPLGLTRR